MEMQQVMLRLTTDQMSAIHSLFEEKHWSFEDIIMECGQHEQTERRNTRQRVGSSQQSTIHQKIQPAQSVSQPAPNPVNPVADPG